MDEGFRIDRTRPTVFIDNAGNAVQGFQVNVTLLKWDEGHTLNTRSLDPEVVMEAVAILIEQRQALEDMSS